jgi:hypothetical protein
MEKKLMMYRNNGAISLSRTVKSDGKKEKIIKFCRGISLYRIGMFFVLFGFIYQSIDTTISYLKYETLFHLKSELLSQETPSVSLCIDSLEDILYLKKWNTRNKSLGEYFYRLIDCKIKYSRKSAFEKCNENFEIIESVTPYAHRCITFFSQLNSSKYSVSSEIYLEITVSSLRKILSAVHKTKTPPHFFKNYVTHKTRYTFSSLIFSSKERLLPFPYQTNCDSYDQNPYKSREHCILDHMKRLEYDICNCNRKWFYKSLNVTKVERICAKNECKVEFNENQLNSKCRKNCYNEYYNNRIVAEKRFDDNFQNWIQIFLVKVAEKELLYIHLPKMDFIQYLGSIGGLISFWFGYSLYDIASILLSKLFNSSCMRRKVYKLNFRHFQRLEKICVKVLLIIFFCLLSYQIFEEIVNYTKYETIYKTQICRQINLPNIEISNKLSNRNIKGLIKIYPELGAEVKRLLKRISPEYEIKQKIENSGLKYWRKLLEDNKLQEFMDLLNSTKFLKSCNFVIKGNSIDCGQIIYRIVFSSEGITNIYEIGLILGKLNQSYKNMLLEEDIGKNLDKITIELTRLHNNYVVINSHEALFVDDSSFETDVYYSSYSMHRLSNSRFRCNETNTEFSFLQKDRINDCLLFLNNQTHGCLALQKMRLVFDVNKHLLNEGYRICPTNISVNKSVLTKWQIKCSKSFSIGCKETHFEKKIKFYRKLDKNITTKRINIIPMKTAHIDYLEQLRINFDQLIYTCCGIVGLWFGLSPNQISNLILIVFHYLKLFVNYLFRVH